MKKLLLAITALVLSVAAQAQTTAADVLTVTRKANDYFMQKHNAPEADTYVHNKKRPSSLWTRGVYYEGLTALYEVDRSSVTSTISTAGPTIISGHRVMV